MLNEKNVALKLKRSELVDLMIACYLVDSESNNEKWKLLHDKINNIIIEFDECEKKRGETK